MSFLSLKNSKQNKKSYLQFFETDEIFGEHYDRLLAGHQRNERTQTLFFHLITDRGKFAVKNEDGMGRRKERTDFGSSAAPQLAEATLTARLFCLAGGHFFPFKKLSQRKKFSQSS